MELDKSFIFAWCGLEGQLQNSSPVSWAPKNKYHLEVTEKFHIFVFGKCGFILRKSLFKLVLQSWSFLIAAFVVAYFIKNYQVFTFEFVFGKCKATQFPWKFEGSEDGVLNGNLFIIIYYIYLLFFPCWKVQ